MLDVSWATLSRNTGAGIFASLTGLCSCEALPQATLVQLTKVVLEQGNQEANAANPKNADHRRQ